MYFIQIISNRKQDSKSVSKGGSRIQDDFWGGGVDLMIKLPYSIKRQAWANSIDPDQTPQNAASDQGLHCKPLIQQFYTFILSKIDLLKKSVR